MNDLIRRNTPAHAINLNARSRAYVEKSVAENTRRAYANAWKDFAHYCDFTAHTAPLPCAPQTIIDYLTRLADSGAAVSTIDQRIAAIAFMHRIGEFEDPTAHSAVRQLMSGIRRARAELSSAVKQVAPITRDDLFLLIAALPDDLRGKRDKALLLVGFACARRESEIVALNVSDIEFTRAGMVVTIRRSKTDQTGEGRKKRVPRLSEENEMICPVRAMRAWLTASEITAGALFRKVDRWGKVWAKGLNARAVEFIIKRSMSLIGRDASLYAGHSLRVGFTTQAGEDGSPLHEIMDVTDHKSMDMVRHYLRNQGLTTPRTIKRTLGE